MNRLTTLVYNALRGPTVHWIGAQFCVCIFLDSRDKCLNLSKFCQNDQREGKNKRRLKGASLFLKQDFSSLSGFSKKTTQTAQTAQTAQHFVAFQKK